jgi:hypothetical protein
MLLARASPPASMEAKNAKLAALADLVGGRINPPADLEQGIERRIPEPARVGEHTFDVLARSRESGAAVVELRELELGRSDGAEARVGDARRNAAVDLAACGNAEGHRAAATAMACGNGASRT